ncbi:MAG: hypothetical protein WCF90_03310 [Methanomicrobiales archaeon]
MKRIIIIALCLACITGTASAYGLYLSCPESIQAGLPLKCSIDSDFPVGTTFNIVFYQTQYTSTEVSRQPITIQDNQVTQYKLLDTEGLPGGNYKVEVQYTGGDEPRLRSDSKTLQLVKLIDRSGDITITSPMTQNLEDALRIEGSIYKLGNGGVRIEVRGPEGVTLRDEWIGSKEQVQNGAGIFTMLLPVIGAGDYYVIFTDQKGYIGMKTFHVGSITTQVTTTVPTITSVKTPKPPTIVPTAWPTAAQSPLSPLTAFAGLAATGLVSVFVMKRN